MPPSKNFLARKTKPQLITQSERKGLPVEGTKKVLIDRLLANYAPGQNFGGAAQAPRGRGRPARRVQQPALAQIPIQEPAVPLPNQPVNGEEFFRALYRRIEFLVNQAGLTMEQISSYDLNEILLGILYEYRINHYA
jgi:hypothetical protein